MILTSRSILIFTSLMVACGPGNSTPTPTPTEIPGTATLTPTETVESTPTETSEMTPTATSELTPTATAEITPTPTPTPTATAIPTPTAVPTPTPVPTPIECHTGTIELEGACVADLENGWQQIIPEGDTICSRGTPFSFFVRKGTANKLAVAFDGGGACWDAVTCSEENPSFSETVNATGSDNPENLADGALDFDNPENPAKDYFMVFVPYCTGDIHWGNTVTTYPPKAGYPEVTIQHKGFVNGTAVMDWVYANFSGPDNIFVTGVSAGAYGSLLFAPYLMEHYPNALSVQNGDAGAGVVTEEFMGGEEGEGFNAWNPWPSFPPYLLEAFDGIPYEELDFADAYIAAANYFPNAIFSQYNAAEDDVQAGFYLAMGGNPLQWGTRMNLLVQDITNNTPGNFSYYTNWGSRHGILPYSEFYTYQTNGTRIRDWYADLLMGTLPENVQCTDCISEEYYTPAP